MSAADLLARVFKAFGRSRGGSTAPVKLPGDVLQAWGGRWRGTEIFSEHCRVKAAALGLAKTLVECLEPVGAPVVVSFAKPHDVGQDRSGRIVMWGFAIHIAWPDFEDVTAAVAKAVEDASWKNEGHGPLSFPVRGQLFKTAEEAVAWCHFDGGNWACNVDRRPTAERRRARDLRDLAPAIHLTQFDFAAVSADGTTLATRSGSTVSILDAVSCQVRTSFRDATREIHSVAVAPDGRTVVTTSMSSASGQTASVWDAQTGAERFVLAGHTSWIWGAAYSPDGKLIVTAGNDGTARVWDADVGTLLRTFEGQGGVARCVAVFPDGLRAATGTAGGSADVKVWDAGSGSLVIRLAPTARYQQQVAACAVSPDGSQVAGASSGTGDHLVHVWDAASGQELTVCREHTNLITCLAWSPNGRYLLSGDYSHKARLFDARSGAQVGQLPLPPVNYNHVSAVGFFPDGSRLFVASSTTGVRIFTAEALGMEFAG